MEKTKTAIILIGLTVLAFCLRWYLMPSHLFFGPEQGRDFLVVRDIVVNHKFTLIGSKTDVDGVFHGPVYYYLAAIPFALSRGNPVAVMAFFIAIQSLGVYLAYLLAFELTQKKRAGYIAASVYASSYLLVVYSRWLSNPPLSIPLSLLFMLCLVRFIRRRQWYLIAAAFVYGLFGQAEFINYLLIAVIGVFIIFAYWKQSRKTTLAVWLCASVVGLATSFVTYFLFDLRHDFLVSKGVIDLLSGRGGYQLYFITSAAGAFRVLMEQAAQMVGLSGWIWGFVVTIAVMCTLCLSTRKNSVLWILAIWIWVPPVLFAILRHGMLDQLYAGIVVGFVILLAVSIEWVWEKSRIVGMGSLVIIVLLNIFSVMQNLPDNHNVFFQPQQPAVRYTDQLAAIDWIYARAQDKPFSLQSYTIPYFWQDAWTYLFGYNGFRKYGYLPDNKGRKLIFVIIQRDTLDPNFQKNWLEKTVSAWGSKINEVTIGEYRVVELAVNP